MKVYLNELVSDSVRKKLADHYEIVDNLDHPEELDAMLVRQTAVDKDLIEKAVNLKVISMHGIGLDRIDVKAAEEHGIQVFNVPGVGAEAVGELAVTYMMALSRNLKKAQNGLAEGRFKTFGPAELVGHELTDKVLGVIGMGNISQVVIRIMRNAFNMTVLGYDPHATKEKAQSLGVEKVETLYELFERSDFVNISVPLTDSTRNMINADVLSHSKKDLIIVNTARGGIINEEDLYVALKEGKLGGAGLDVTVEEPISKDNPLLDLENVMCSPHIGGSTYESRERVGMIAVDNIIKVLGE